MAIGTEQDGETAGRQNQADNPPNARKVWWFKQPSAIERFTGWLVLWTALLFAANVVTDIFVWQQWKVANKSQIDTREQLRAVVTIEAVFVAPISDESKKIVSYNIVPSFHNFGGTRTAGFKAWLSVKYFEGGVPNNLDLGKPYNAVDMSNQIIGPNSSYQLPPAGVPAADVDSALGNKGVILLWGVGDYSDIFDPATIHTFQFCSTVKPQADPTTKVVAFATLPFRPDCNKAGE